MISKTAQSVRERGVHSLCWSWQLRWERRVVTSTSSTVSCKIHIFLEPLEVAFFVSRTWRWDHLRASWTQDRMMSEKLVAGGSHLSKQKTVQHWQGLKLLEDRGPVLATVANSGYQEIIPNHCWLEVESGCRAACCQFMLQGSLGSFCSTLW